MTSSLLTVVANKSSRFQVDFVSTKELVTVVLNADAAPLKAKSSGEHVFASS